MKEITEKCGVNPQDVGIYKIKPINQFLAKGGLSINSPELKAAFDSTRTNWGLTEHELIYVTVLFEALQNDKDLGTESVSELRVRLLKSNMPENNLYEPGDLNILTKIFTTKNFKV